MTAASGPAGRPAPRGGSARRPAPRPTRRPADGPPDTTPVSASGRAPSISLEVTGLRVWFGGVRAVDGFDLRHDRGGVVGLIGPNGAGKTTVLNVLSGVIPATAGSAHLDGLRLDGLRPDRIARAGVARTFQNLQTFGSLSVLDNVLVPVDAARAARPVVGLFHLLTSRHSGTRRAAAQRLLDDVGLAEFADRPAASLPYPMQRRLEVARALAAQPRLLLLDEPLAGLSATERGNLATLFRAIARYGVTVLLVEHDVATVLRTCDRVVVLDSGRVLADGTPAEVRADPRVQRAYLGAGAA